MYPATRNPVLQPDMEESPSIANKLDKYPRCKQTVVAILYITFIWWAIVWFKSNFDELA